MNIIIVEYAHLFRRKTKKLVESNIIPYEPLIGNALSLKQIKRKGDK